MAAKLARSHRPHARAPSEGRALLKVGDLLAGKYRVERILGEGGMGVVVAAHHELLDQRVAVKLLYQDIADREAQTRLLQEARAAARLQSEHVARVVDVDTGEDGLPFIVMELLDGADLCQIADARGALPRWLVVDYILQALEGLAHAHARGIIHRDLKPSNLFLANRLDGTQIIKILDFGIAKAPSTETDRHLQQLTGGRSVLGSPPYMSPEQVRAPKTVDHRTDIWSIGVCMYELLTNSMPFGGEEIQETFAQILEKEPAPIRHLVTGVPEGLEQVVMKCLAKNRNERYADVGELARALVPFGSGTWIQSAERIATTLMRVAADEVVSATRLKGAVSERIAIPSAPGRRAEPELNGTSSTVAARFSVVEAKRFWMFGVAAVFIFIGVGFIAVTALSHRYEARQVEPASTGVAAEIAPGETAAPVPGPATTLITAPVTTAGPENDVGGGGAAPTATVVGASPAAPATTAKKPVASVAPPKPASSSSPVRRPPPPSKPALPPGLPRERQ
jgi:serine/threonine-protein kinase